MNDYDVHMVNDKATKNVELELKILSKIEESENLSQRMISKDLNVALGLANSLIKKFVKKGFLKLKEAPMKRYLYYLTPKGLLEKTKLTREFLETSLFFFKKSKEEYENEFKKIKNKNKIIVLCGISDFTDIAILAAKIQNVEISYIYQKKDKRKNYCGIEIIGNLIKIKQKKNVHFFATDNHKNPSLISRNNHTFFKPKSLIE